MNRVLIVEDEAGLREGLVDVIAVDGPRARAPRRPRRGAPGARARAGRRRRRPVDCVLLDIRLRDGDGLDFLRELRAGPARDVPVIVRRPTATASAPSARCATAPSTTSRSPSTCRSLLATVERAVKQRALAQSTAPAPPPAEAPGDLVGTSAAMLAIWKLIGRAAASDAPVLITGETGTGKELVARAIHRYSPRVARPVRRRQPRGAAADAHRERALRPREGRLHRRERAPQRPLRARRRRHALPRRDRRPRPGAADQAAARACRRARSSASAATSRSRRGARLLAATNKPVRPGAPGVALREDLYYRLAVIEIELPPLRARKSDIPLLVAHALARHARARRLRGAPWRELLAYDWPGNVRELFHVLERAAVMCGGEVIDVVEPAGPARPRRARAPSRPPTTTCRCTPRRPASSAGSSSAPSSAPRATARRPRACSASARPLLYTKLEEHGLGGKNLPHDGTDDDGSASS